MFLSRHMPHITALILLLCILSPLRGADLTSGAYYAKHWRVEDGLPQSTVYALAQDHDGYLWVATFGGLVRFDGSRFFPFDRSSDNGIPVNFIRDLATDGDGRITASSPDADMGGVWRQEGRNFAPATILADLPSRSIQVSLTDSQGRLWLGTRGNGVLRIDKGLNAAFGAPEGVPAGRISALYETAKGELWAAVWGGGVIRFDGARFVVDPPLNALSGQVVSDIVEMDDGALLFATFKDGLYRLSGNTLTHHPLRTEGSGGSINSLYRDRDGAIWVATRTDGLLLFDGRTFLRSVVNDDLADIHVRAVLRDNAGNLWVGTYTNGLHLFAPSPFRTIRPRDGLSDASVSTLIEARDGSVWIGTHNHGLNRLTNNTIKRFTADNGYPLEGIRALTETADGSLWIGTDGNGLVRYDGRTFTAITSDQGLLHNVVYGLFEDRARNLWVSLGQGDILVGRDGRFNPFTLVRREPTDPVFFFHEDDDGTLWFLSAKHLTRFANGTATDINTDAAQLTTLYRDREGTLWVGSYRGIGILHGSSITYIGKKEGLPSEAVTAMVEDDHGNFWFASGKGIFRIPRRQLISAFEKQASPLLEPDLFGISDGLAALENNEGQRAFLKHRDGSFWFATTRGVSFTDPTAQRTPPPPPPARIERFLINGESVDISGEKSCPADKDRFEFHYTGIEFAAPEQLVFRYHLAGFDTAWRTGTPARVVTYQLTEPGNYRFEVQACLRGHCGEIGGLSFRREALWYQKIGFYAALFFFFTGAAYLLSRHHIRKVQQKNDELAEMVEEKGQEVDTLTEELKEKYETSRLDESTAVSMLKEIAAYMETRKPYLDPEFRLKKISDETGIAPHHISQILNLHLKKNFYAFINEYRIEEAKRILADTRQYQNILDAAYRSGFNSKSAFNVIFKKATGMTPTEYLRSLNTKSN